MKAAAEPMPRRRGLLIPAILLLGALTILIALGTWPLERREGKQDPKTRAEGQPSGVIDIVGALRWPEPRGMFTPADQPGKNLWFARDPAAMAAAKGWGDVAPFYIDQEAPIPPGGLPKPGPLKPSLPNNHLQYAVTWYGLALMFLISAVFFERARRRDARASI